MRLKEFTDFIYTLAEKAARLSDPILRKLTSQ